MTTKEMITNLAGPWRYDGDYVVDKNNETVVRLVDNYFLGEAIAAVPEMLSLLSFSIYAENDLDWELSDLNEIAIGARKIIAKIEKEA